MAPLDHLDRKSYNQIARAEDLAIELQNEYETDISTVDLLAALGYLGFMLVPATTDDFITCDNDGNKMSAALFAYFCHLEIMKGQSHD